ncbi:SulP family inorganic anion transporter [Sulfitobacter sp. F26169L]|uniref:SulP family inorganic anion transporter n=1 Tax=Sulfitobacter sp. F26169L TaxID=2996015 RepID=UPI002260E88A|nr:SulP family inorganic anion transporter [Sulfitobacter sp. F26169L]MCX7565012.1 SulP family inorganic anion transporter [Sulfitobacter sp. F26169L]
MHHRLNALFSSLNPIRPWFGRVTSSTIKADAIAGLTNAAIVLPQGVAFAIIAGLPPEFGLFTAVVVALIAGLWGSSMIMVSGPTTAISAVILASMSQFATPGSETYIAMVFTLTLMVGIIQIIAGFFKLGGLISFISHSVLIGFTAAAAFLIAASQLGGALGIEKGEGGGVFERVSHVVGHISQINTTAVIISGVTIVTLIVLSKFSKKIPSYIIALGLGAGVAYVLDAPAQGVAMFAPLQSIIPAVSAPELSFSLIAELLPVAATVAFVGLLEAISIGRSFALRRDEEYDSSQEMVGQGLSNTVGSFFQCYAGSGSFTRSGLNADAGAQTPVSTVFAAAFLVMLLIALAPYLQYVPVPAMAGVILFVSYRLINFAEIKHVLHSNKSETAILAATFLTGIFTELDLAIVVGVIVSLCVFLYSSAHPVVAVGAPTDVNGRRVFKNASRYGLPECPQISVIRVDGPLFFASVENVEQQFRRIENACSLPQIKLMGLKGLWKIDMSGAGLLLKEIRRARKAGADFHLFTTNASSFSVLRRLGVLSELGESNLHNNKAEAIAKAVESADDDICRRCELRVFLECAQKPHDPPKKG